MEIPERYIFFSFDYVLSFLAILSLCPLLFDFLAEHPL